MSRSQHALGHTRLHCGSRFVLCRLLFTAILRVSRSAREALDLLLLPATPSSPNSTKAITYFDELEIYPGTHTPSITKTHLASSTALHVLMICCFSIYPNWNRCLGSKIAHFKALHKKTGIPHEEMLFFDDESRNKEVSKLGVTFVLTPRGVNRKVFEKGVKVWAESFVIEEAKEET